MDKVQILLKEYEICHEDSNALGSRYWSFANIFIPANFVLLGLLLSVIIGNHSKLNEYIILAIGLAAIIILICVLSWLLRANKLHQLNYDRAREIEVELGMWKNWRVHAIDHFKNKSFDKSISKDMTSKLLEYHDEEWWQEQKKSRFLRPNIGFYSVFVIFCILILLWVGLIVCGFVIPPSPIHHHPCSMPNGY